MQDVCVFFSFHSVDIYQGGQGNKTTELLKRDGPKADVIVTSTSERQFSNAVAKVGTELNILPTHGPAGCWYVFSATAYV